MLTLKMALDPTSCKPPIRTEHHCVTLDKKKHSPKAYKASYTRSPKCEFEKNTMYNQNMFCAF